MKKTISVVLALVLVLATLAGCAGTSGSSNPGDAASGNNNAGQAGKKYTIGICQQLEHPALDEATRGFMEACEKLFGKDNVEIQLQNGQNEQTNCATINNNFVAGNVDLILANATTALQTAAAATNTIPILGTSITSYGIALDIPDMGAATGSNISGTSDLAPIDEQAAMLLELFPDVKKWAFCTARQNPTRPIRHSCSARRWMRRASLTRNTPRPIRMKSSR